MKGNKHYFLKVVFISVLAFMFFPDKTEAKIIQVGPMENIKSIREGIKSSIKGDLILVKTGVYHEGNIIIDKSVELSGEDMPEINGDNKFEIMTIKADNVKVKGFIFKNAGFSDLTEQAGIRVENASGCSIENNHFFNTPFAVYLANTKNCLVKNNIVKGLAKKEVSYGAAIHIWKSKKIIVENNDLSGHRDGIYFEFVKNSRVINNNSHNNIRYGLHFMYSDGNSYKKNSFIKNNAGVAVMYTNNIEMIENTFEDNWGPASYGLLLKEIRNSKILRNKFIRNTMGIYLDGGHNINASDNFFLSNGYALKLIGNSYNNKINNNNFIANSFDVISNASGEMNNNTFAGNYWDRYSGYDLNRDKIGDVPFRPVSLFSMIMEKIPYSVLLMRSMFISLLDISEKVIPVFTPKTIIDESPRMILNK